MNYVLLLGAGFSRNWGGWLAAEAFEYLLGCHEIRNSAALRSVLWKHQPSGGFEYALAEVQEAYIRDQVNNKTDLESIQGAVSKMFDDMNATFFKQRFEFQSQIAQTVTEFLSKFDTIFTLNQDLLLEHHYLCTNLASGPYRNWNGHDLPGVRLAPNSEDHGHLNWSLNKWMPMDPREFAIKPGTQPLVKLHGSSNWEDANRGQLLIIGGNKAREISLHPIFSWYARMFDEFLQRPNTRLMIIGYGFRDEHINEAIDRAVNDCELQIFNISPHGSEQARSLNATRNRGQVQVNTPLEKMFERSLIGASRRPLDSVFGRDITEHGKVMRFFKN